MTSTSDHARNVDVVERFLACFDHRWPTEAELDELIRPDVTFVERPNLISPTGSERDADAIRSGVEAGRRMLAWQSYKARDHIVAGDSVVTRMRWEGELAVAAGQWPAGTRLAAWCVAHYRVVDGRIAAIEQHDCYEPARPPEEPGG
jgi:ketosteroid isomerase-like protein